MENRDESTRDGVPTVCSACGAVVDRGEWHPTEATPAEDGGTEIHVFCDGQCLDEWPGNE